MSFMEKNMEKTCRSITDVLTRGVFEKLSEMTEKARDVFFNEKPDFSDLGFDNKTVMLFSTLENFNKNLLLNASSGVEISDTDFDELFNQNHNSELMKTAQESLSNSNFKDFK